MERSGSRSPIRLRPLAREAVEIAEGIGFPSWCDRASSSGARAPASPRTPSSSDPGGRGLAASPVTDSARAVHCRVEGVPARGDARRGRQLCRGLLDREFRPDGSARGDSITVAPAQTLTDVKYQAMRDDAFACLRRVGVETGGSTIQFAVDPATGRRVIIEMNPRVSRSSALASKATGFPIAKIAARLAVGYRLNEIPNDITEATPASFEPTIDYVVTKVTRWAFENFTGAEPAWGPACSRWARSWPSGAPSASRSRRPCVRSSRGGPDQRGPGRDRCRRVERRRTARAGRVATPDRVFQLEAALRRGAGVDELVARTGIDPWFVRQLARITEERQRLTGGRRWTGPTTAGPSGWGSRTPSWPTCVGAAAVVRAERLLPGVEATFKTVDTCAWSSRRSRRTTTPPTRKRTRCGPPSAPASSSWALARPHRAGH